jgi:hypothetical protein
MPPALTPVSENVLAPASPPLPDIAATGRDSSVVSALIAISLAGLSLILSQVPYGRIGSVALASLGLILGLVGLSLATRGKLLPGLGSLINAAVLVVVIAVPSLLGVGSWWPATVADDSGVVKAVRHNSGGESAPAEWVEAGKESWRQGDVLVSVRAFTVGPVQLTGPNGKKVRTKESYLQIWLRVTNEGITRKIEFAGWNAAETSAGLRLSDSAGKRLPAKRFEAGWEPPGRLSSVTLFPGKSAENLLLFAAPSAATGDLRLELPASAFGSSETVRFTLSQASLKPARKKMNELIDP